MTILSVQGKYASIVSARAFVCFITGTLTDWSETQFVWVKVRPVENAEGKGKEVCAYILQKRYQNPLGRPRPAIIFVDLTIEVG
jgi:hypothetical protein